MSREDPSENSGSEDEDINQKPDLAYDPDQDLGEKREIRRRYRSLIDETNGVSPPEEHQNLELTRYYLFRTKSQPQECESVRDRQRPC